MMNVEEEPCICIVLYIHAHSTSETAVPLTKQFFNPGSEQDNDI